MTATIACPFCQEQIPAAALICGKCQAVLVSVEWQQFAERFKWASPVERGKSLEAMATNDRERFPLVWSALRLGPFPEVMTAEKRAEIDAAMKKANRWWGYAFLIIIGTIVAMLAVAVIAAKLR